MDLEQKRKQGRPRKAIEASELDTLRRLVEADPSISLRAIAEAMATQSGKRLSLMAWSRALKSLGISKVTAKKTITSEEKPAASKTTHYRAVHRREPEPGRYPIWRALAPTHQRMRIQAPLRGVPGFAREVSESRGRLNTPMRETAQ